MRFRMVGANLSLLVSNVRARAPKHNKRKCVRSMIIDRLLNFFSFCFLFFFLSLFVSFFFAIDFNSYYVKSAVKNVLLMHH